MTPPAQTVQRRTAKRFMHETGMLRDLLEFVRNPYPWHLAAMGYVREVSGIADRARALAPAWREHLDRTRRAISTSAEASRGRGSVLVDGSGNLLDVPLDCLCARFGRVVLLDIVHSRQVRKAVSDRSNVELLSADVTGVAHAVYRAARSRDVSVLPRSVPPDLDGRQFDLIISVNILSQLGVTPCRYLKAHCPAIPPKRLHMLSRDLIETHLAWIRGRAPQSCLITDVRRAEHVTGGTSVETDILEGLALPEPDETWDWQIAPLNSVYPDREVVHCVHAFHDLR